jgi:hypothetical protein
VPCTQYLSSKHPQGALLFPSSSSRSYASFLNTWTQTVLGPLIGPLTRPAVWELLDEDSKEYFEHKKVSVMCCGALCRQTRG